MGGGEFDVISGELTAAAGKIRSAVSPVACYHFTPTSVSAESFGHVEVASVFGQLCTKLDQAVSALAKVGEDMAGGLDTTAKAYTEADQQQSRVYAGGQGTAQAR